MNTELQGRMMLKVVGIIYIVFSGITMLGGVLALLGGGIFLAGGATAGEVMSAGMGGLAVIAGLILIVSSALGLVAGILGVKYCNRQDKAQTCFILGIVLVVFAAISLLSSLGGDGNVLSGLVGLVLPVLYTLGAYKNKQSVPSYGGYNANSQNFPGQNFNGQNPNGQNFNTSMPGQNPNGNIQFPGQNGAPVNGQNNASQAQQPAAPQQGAADQAESGENTENRRTVTLEK